MSRVGLVCRRGSREGEFYMEKCNYCRNCGVPLTDNADVCMSCGVYAGKGDKYCQNCGAETNPFADVCVKCGAKLIKYEEKTQSTAPDKNKTTAAVLAILLGSIGAHKFYMGYNKEGVEQILLSLLCGIGWILGIIEGIIYISKSEADFQATYIDGHKSWL